jgi:uncharacterized membrane protein YgdD (TMEM256/DUF423 family)
MLMAKLFMCSAALMGLVGVIAGALGAHAVQPGLSAVDASSYETAVVYLFVHALALAIVALILRLSEGQWVLKVAGWAFISGILLFSCSIILRLGLELSFPFPLAPYGGMSLMVGWLSLFIGGLLRW